MSQSKVCIKCGEEKDIDLFNNRYGGNVIKKTGSCKECTKKKNIAWSKANPEKAKAFSKKSREKLKKTAYFAEYAKNNKDRINARHREWTKKNPEKSKIAQKKSRQKNKGKYCDRIKSYLSRPDVRKRINEQSRIRCQREDVKAKRRLGYNKRNEADKVKRRERTYRVSETKKLWQKNNRSKLKEYAKKYYNNNAEKEKKRRKKYREENKETILKKMKESRINNPERTILHDVKTVLKRNGLNPNEVPKEYIAAKVNYLIIKKTIKTKKDANNKKCSTADV